MENYPEELKENYEKLSPKLKEALASPEISERVLAIVDRFKIPEEKIEGLAMLSTMIFLGVLPLPELAKELKEELGIEENISKEIARSLETEVFSNYKNELEKIYISESMTKSQEEEEIQKVKKETVQQEVPKEKPTEKIEIKEELLKKKGPDKYLEPIEVTEKDKARIIKEGGRIKKVF